MQVFGREDQDGQQGIAAQKNIFSFPLVHTNPGNGAKRDQAKHVDCREGAHTQGCLRRVKKNDHQDEQNEFKADRRDGVSQPISAIGTLFENFRKRR